MNCDKSLCFVKKILITDKQLGLLLWKAILHAN